MEIGSADEFIRLRNSDDPREYDRAARGSASVDVWRQVIDRYPQARFWVAQNKTVPVEILEILAADQDPRVRTMVALKRKAPEEILAQLSTDSEPSVREAVAKNKNTSRKILELLSMDSWDSVRDAARMRLPKG